MVAGRSMSHGERLLTWLSMESVAADVWLLLSCAAGGGWRAEGRGARDVELAVGSEAGRGGKRGRRGGKRDCRGNNGLAAAGD